jgi:hypothetical protein
MTTDHDNDERRGAGDGGAASRDGQALTTPREAPASARSKVRAAVAIWRRRAGARAERKRKAAQATVYVARDGRGRVTNAR